MNLYLRLIWLLIRMPFMGRSAHPLDETSLDMRVLPNDLDLNMHMNNGRYLTIMDLGRLHLTYCNRLLGRCLKRGWLPVLGSAKIHFIKSLNIFEKYQLKTKVIYWDEKWIYLEQDFMKQGEVCATALVKALFTSKKGKITSQQVIDLMDEPVEKPTIPKHLERWIVAEKRDENNSNLS